MKRCTETDSAIMRCPDYPWKCEMCGAYKEPTNADHIRSMTDEELAKILVFWEDDYGRWWTDAGCVYDDTEDHRERAVKKELDWLKQPYKEEDNE